VQFFFILEFTPMTVINPLFMWSSSPPSLILNQLHSKQQRPIFAMTYRDRRTRDSAVAWIMPAVVWLKICWKKWTVNLYFPPFIHQYHLEHMGQHYYLGEKQGAARNSDHCKAHYFSIAYLGEDGISWTNMRAEYNEVNSYFPPFNSIMKNI
jgi:hypothetical protein